MAPSLRPWRSARPGILPPTSTRPKPSRRRRTRDAETTPATRCSSLAASVAGGLCALRYPLAFNVGTSLVLVPAYMALLLTRRAPKSAVDRIWSQSDPKGAPWRGERWRARDGSRWWLGALVPAVLGAIFLGLLAENAAAFAGVLRACWSGKIPALQFLLRDSATTVLVWTQITLVDFVAARHVLSDAREAGVPARHSVAVCFVVGPAGLLSHLVTKALAKRK